MKKAHILRPNRKMEIPRHFLFYDTETAQELAPSGETIHRLRMGWAVYWRRGEGKRRDREVWCHFRKASEFWEFVFSHLSRRTRMYLIAHNQTFDTVQVDAYNFLNSAGWKLVRFYDRKPVYIAVWRKQDYSLVFLDNSNYFKSSLRELGAQVGLEKLEVDFASCSEEELSVYCRRDVEILLHTWKKWLSFHEENDLGCFGFTVAAQAFNTFRHRFLDYPILIHDRTWAYRLEREAYFGGRVECRFIGRVPESPIYVLDINSMYPSLMWGNLFPTKLIGRDRQPSLPAFSHYLEKYLVVAQVLLQTEEPAYPFRMSGKLIFPVGCFRTTLATPEASYAMQKGHVLRVGEVILYEGAPIFGSFIRFFWEARKKAKSEGDAAGSLFYKILMNSLYGKFGQKGERWVALPVEDNGPPRYWREFDLDTGRWVNYRAFAGRVEMSTDPEEAYHSFPAIAAHVTSWARMYLWHLMLLAGLENVYYCDTDSLFVNQKGYESLQVMVNPKALGMLSLKSIVPILELYGPKSYRMGDKLTLKGVRKGAQEVAPGVWRQEQWPSLSTLIRHGDLSTYPVAVVDKHLSFLYDKGQVTPEGWVLPWRLSLSSSPPPPSGQPPAQPP